jgi:hypothetical protein
MAVSSHPAFNHHVSLISEYARPTQPTAAEPIGAADPAADNAGRTGDLLACAGLSLLWLCSVVVVGVRGDFPLSDDWAYARSVKVLVESGQFTRTEWTWVPLVTHTLLGAAFSKVFGFSFETLRLCTLVMGWVGLMGMYTLCRQAGARHAMAAFVAALLALNPLYLNLSFTFMTEIPFAALVVWAIVFWVRGLRTNSLITLVAGATLIVAATLSRQFGIGFAAAMGAAAILGARRRPSRWLVGIAVPAIAVAAYLLVPHLLYGNKRRGTVQSDIWIAKNLITGGSFVFHILRSGTYAFATTGLLLLPLAVLIPRTRHGRRPLLLAATAALAMLVLVCAVLKGWRMPGLNVINEDGVGPIVVTGAVQPGPFLTATWWVLTAVSVSSAAYVLTAVASHLWRERRNLRTNHVLACTLGGALLYLGLTTPWQFDRYLVPALPAMLIIVLLTASAGPAHQLRPGWTAVALLLALGAFSVTGTRDYLTFNRIRWDALNALVASGVTTDRIDGGFEFNAWHNYTTFRDPIHRSAKGKWVRDNEYILSLADSVSGYTKIDERRCEGLLAQHQLSVFRRDPTAPESPDAPPAPPTASR